MTVEPLPTNIDRFDIQSLLGEGSVAWVYEAFDPKMKRKVAIKVLKLEYAAEPQHRLRFTHEAIAAGRVSDHPAIATLYEVGEESNDPFIVMEYGGADNLEAYHQRHPELSLKRIIMMAIDIADALAYGHERGIIHRDIKPANIICREDGQVRITDFGIASLLSLEKKSADDDWLMGSPHYMSPEQIRGDNLDGRADVFSLGVMLYELVSGRLPFGGNNLDALSEHICHGEHQSLLGREDIPTALAQLIDQCLTKTPDERVASASALANELRAVLTALEDETQVKSSSDTTLGRWFAGVAASLLVVGCLLTVSMTHNQRQSLDQLTEEYGLAFTSFLAHQSIEPILLADEQGPQPLNSLVDQLSAQDWIESIVITDHQGVALASSEVADLNQPYDIDATAVQQQSPHTPHTATLYQHRDGRWEWRMPVEVMEQTIGDVFVTLSAKQRSSVFQNTSIWMIAWVALTLTALAVLWLRHSQRLSLPSLSLKTLWMRMVKRLRLSRQKSQPTATQPNSQQMDSQRSPKVDSDVTQIRATDTMSRRTRTDQRRKRRRVTTTSVASNQKDTNSIC